MLWDFCDGISDLKFPAAVARPERSGAGLQDDELILRVSPNDEGRSELVRLRRIFAPKALPTAAPKRFR
jgi:hypothetical protein